MKTHSHSPRAFISAALVLFTTAASAGDPVPRATYFWQNPSKKEQAQIDAANKAQAKAEAQAEAARVAEYHRQINTFVKETSRRLDIIEKDLDEWGHGSFSGLELIPLPSGKEHESLASGGNRSYTSILDDVNASVQGGASLVDSSALGLGLGLDLKLDPLGAPSQALTQAQDLIARDRLENARKEEADVATLLHQQRMEVEKQKLANLQESAATPATPTAEPALPTTPPATTDNPLFSTPVGDLPAPPAQQTGTPAAGTGTGTGTSSPLGDRLLSNPVVINSTGTNIGFTAPQGLTTATLAATQAKSRTISPAEASAQAKSIAIQERITDLIANPVAIDGNRVLYMGIAQVSVSPGSRTREGYACEVTVRAELMDSETDTGGDKQISVFGMFPQARSQTLDLAYSKRSQFQLLMNLAMQYAAVGQEANGKAVLDYVKRLEKDVDTRSSLPVLVPNSDGTQVTYRFDPSLQALGDPAADKSKPANLLHATSVPVLLALACDKEEVHSASLIRLRMTTRWVPLEKRHWAKKYMVDWWHKAYANQDARYDDTSIIANAKRLDEIVTLMYQYKGILGKSGDVPNKNLRDAVATRYRILEPRVSGNLITRSMPMPWKKKEEPKTDPVPAIVNLSPPAISETNLSPQFAIRLQHFGEAPILPAVFKVYLGGQESQATTYSGGKDGILTASFRQIQQLPAGPVDLLVIRTDTSLSAAIRALVVPIHPPPETPPPLAVAEIKPLVGHLYATNTFIVKGTGFAKPDKTSAIKAVFADGRDCVVEFISPTLLKVKVPPLRTKPTAPAPTPPATAPVPAPLVATLTFANETEVITPTIAVTLNPSDVVDSGR